METLLIIAIVVVFVRIVINIIAIDRIIKKLKK